MNALEQAKWEIESNLSAFHLQDKVVLELSDDLSEQEFTLVGNGEYHTTSDNLYVKNIAKCLA